MIFEMLEYEVMALYVCDENKWGRHGENVSFWGKKHLCECLKASYWFCRLARLQECVILGRVMEKKIRTEPISEKL